QLNLFYPPHCVHVLQRVSGCEWDNETGEVNGYNQYGYDGEDFIAFDLQTATWITSNRQAETTKLKWNTERARLEYNKNFVIYLCPEFLKRNVIWLSFYLSCHATGFYPHRAVIFWRKDGEELHESVDPGQILPNDDGTFQMSVDLNVSSVTREDWSRYECMFQLSGGEENIITSLKETVIRTNWVESNTKGERKSFDSFCFGSTVDS
uniref:Ig-like domain-containing protein n=1 Tax=Oreochromis aureus TaxID=47969 RepID=A0A668THQ0_OREAU